MGHLGQVRPHRISCPSTMSYHFMSILREKNEKKGIRLCSGRIGSQILGPNCLIFGMYYGENTFNSNLEMESHICLYC